MGGRGALGLQLNPPMSSCCFNYSWTSTRGSHCSKRWRGIFAQGAWAPRVMKKTKKTRIFRVFPQSRSPFSPSLHAFPSSARERVLNLINSGSKGWRSSESARLPPIRPGFKSWRRCHMWVKFVVDSLPCSERFFSGHSGFSLSSKTNISKFQFDQDSGRRRTTLWMCFL